MKIKNRIWIELDGKILIGQGRLNLLMSIAELGSISKAAKHMSMSYKKAWKMVDQINERGKEPLLSMSTGGKNGGGTHITPYGHEIISSYKLLLNQWNEFQANTKLTTN